MSRSNWRNIENACSCLSSDRLVNCLLLNSCNSGVNCKYFLLNSSCCCLESLCHGVGSVKAASPICWYSNSWEMASLCLGVNTRVSVFFKSMFPRWAIKASLSFPDSLGGGGGSVVVVVVVAVVVVVVVAVVVDVMISCVVEDTSAVVVTSTTISAGSVTPVIKSSTSSDFTVVDASSNVAPVVAVGSVVVVVEIVVEVVVAVVVEVVVDVVDVCRGGAQEMPASSSEQI